jgi:hypothetical protein
MKRFSTAALLSFTAVTAVVGVVAYAPLDPDARHAAFLAAMLSGGAGALTLVFKRLALGRQGLAAVFAAMAVGFALRGVLLGIGLYQVAHEGPLAFVISFFSVYLLQQTVELTWVVQAKGAIAT